jgi:hypothetical protein
MDTPDTAVEVLKLSAALLAAVLPFLLTWIFKDKAKKAEGNLLAGVEVAFNVVNEVAKRTPNKVDDKAALGLDFLRQYLKTQGQDLSAPEAERAKLLFKALHAQGE